jgi:hypothetical protein
MAVRLSALHAGRPLPPGRFLVPISVTGRVVPRAIVWLEGLGQLKNTVTSSGINSATFQLLAYCFNQLRYNVPLLYCLGIKENLAYIPQVAVIKTSMHTRMYCVFRSQRILTSAKTYK